jgi:TolB-like protein/tetratricopeptide (TPR) repeat protein
VFLSYASEDAAAAQRIADALRAGGIEVWFDREELRGGDAWDHRIREQLHECRLFLPIVSAHTEARVEGYFRREWRLAVDRTHDLSERIAFLVPVVIDSTSEAKADVPDTFRRVQWTRLPGGETTSAFVDRMRRLLTPEAATTVKTADAVRGPTSAPSVRPGWLSKVLWGSGAIVALACAYLLADKLWLSKPSSPLTSSAVTAAQQTNKSAATAAGFNPPPHSIAVLPFVNMSGDKDQEYFSEGLTEELLNSLSRINELQVAARTSSFSFQGEHPDIATVAHKLNVGAVLEGSVRRSASTVRITTQLVNGVTGFHLWSETYDRNLGDVLKLQTEIATAVASALKVTLLGNEAAKIQVGGTHSPDAFDAYLRGSKDYQNRHGAEEVRAAIAAYTEAIRLDPNYALAFAARSLAFFELGSWWTAESAAWHEAYDEAQSDAQQAIALAPDLGEGHLALADAHGARLEFAHALEEYERAVALAPGKAQVFEEYSDFAGAMGRFDASIAAARRTVLLDPLNPHSHAALAAALSWARRDAEAKAAFQDALALDPQYSHPYAWFFYFALGKYQDARTWCEKRPNDWGSHVCLAIVYAKLGRRADAEAELARYKAGNPAADDWYQYAQIYAEWGDAAKALSCIEKALSTRSPSLYGLKYEPFFDPLRKEPRFQAIERELKFPD